MAQNVDTLAGVEREKVGPAGPAIQRRAHNLIDAAGIVWTIADDPANDRVTVSAAVTPSVGPPGSAGPPGPSGPSGSPGAPGPAGFGWTPTQSSFFTSGAIPSGPSRSSSVTWFPFGGSPVISFLLDNFYLDSGFNAGQNNDLILITSVGFSIGSSSVSVSYSTSDPGGISDIVANFGCVGFR